MRVVRVKRIDYRCRDGNAMTVSYSRCYPSGSYLFVQSGTQDGTKHEWDYTHIKLLLQFERDRPPSTQPKRF